jgi:hypothetical protein
MPIYFVAVTARCMSASHSMLRDDSGSTVAESVQALSEAAASIIWLLGGPPATLPPHDDLKEDSRP